MFPFYASCFSPFYMNYEQQPDTTCIEITPFMYFLTLHRYGMCPISVSCFSCLYINYKQQAGTTSINAAPFMYFLTPHITEFTLSLILLHPTRVSLCSTSTLQLPHILTSTAIATLLRTVTHAMNHTIQNNDKHVIYFSYTHGSRDFAFLLSCGFPSLHIDRRT